MLISEGKSDSGQIQSKYVPINKRPKGTLKYHTCITNCFDNFLTALLFLSGLCSILHFSSSLVLNKLLLFLRYSVLSHSLKKILRWSLVKTFSFSADFISLRSSEETRLLWKACLHLQSLACGLQFSHKIKDSRPFSAAAFLPAWCQDSQTSV